MRTLVAVDERTARESLRRQVARLERRLAALPPVGGAAEAGRPRLLGLGDLERLRDDLVGQLAEAERARRQADRAEADARLRLEAMRADPGAHRGTAVALHELGLPGCGVYRPRPRLGLLGRLAGWWEVKLSSGCPLPGPHHGSPSRQSHVSSPSRSSGAPARSTWMPPSSSGVRTTPSGVSAEVGPRQGSQPSAA